MRQGCARSAKFSSLPSLDASEARRAELAGAETRAFAARHGADPATVNGVRRAFHGRQRQPRSAWLDAAARALILSRELPVARIAGRSGISPASMYELRRAFTRGRRKPDRLWAGSFADAAGVLPASQPQG